MTMTIDREVKRRESLSFAGETHIDIRSVVGVEMTEVLNDEDYKNWPENYSSSLTIQTEDGDTIELALTAENAEALKLKMTEP